MKFKLKELIAKKEIETGRRVTLKDISEELEISRSVLSRMANSRGDYSTQTKYIEKLCKYFNCTPNELMTIE